MAVGGDHRTTRFIQAVIEGLRSGDHLGVLGGCLLVVLPTSDRQPPIAAGTVRLPQGADELHAGKGETMTRTKSYRMKAMAVGAAMTLLLGAGAASAAVARHGADDGVGHVRHSGADDAVGHVRHSGADDAVGHR